MIIYTGISVNFIIKYRYKPLQKPSRCHHGWQNTMFEFSATKWYRILETKDFRKITSCSQQAAICVAAVIFINDIFTINQSITNELIFY